MVKKKKLKKFKYGGGADMGAPGRAQERAAKGYGGTGKGIGGRDPSAATKGKVSDAARKALTAQRERARGRISPSTTPVGRAVAQSIGMLTGIPYFGGKIGAKMVDYSPMAFGVPKGKKRKDMIPTDRAEPQAMMAQQPVAPVPVTPIEKITQAYKKPTISSTGEFGYSVGLKKGGMLKQGKPKLAKKGWK